MSSPVRVLIVDDDASIRDWVRVTLNCNDNYVVAGEACDGADAMEKAVLHRPDLIVLDLQMPLVDGYTTAVMLQRRMPNVKVLLHTASDDAEALAELARLRLPVLQKTGDPQALIDMLDALATGRAVDGVSAVG